MSEDRKRMVGPSTGPKVLVEEQDVALLDERSRFFVPKWNENIEMDRTISRVIALGEKLDAPILLVGPTGCGKTSHITNMANFLGRPCRRINMFGDIRTGDLIGEKTVEIDPATGQSVVVWRDGVITDCKRNGYWLIIDEIDAMPPGIAFVLQSLLEPGHPLTLAANGGELVEQETPGPGLRIFATANTLGFGDSSGIYTGTNVLNAAFLDRFLVAKVDYLPAEEEAALLAPKVGEWGKKLVEFARLIRAGAAKGETTATVSTRRLVSWVTVAAQFSDKPLSASNDARDALREAYGLVVRDKLSDEDRQYFDGVCRRVLFPPQGS